MIQEKGWQPPSESRPIFKASPPTVREATAPGVAGRLESSSAHRQDRSKPSLDLRALQEPGRAGDLLPEAHRVARAPGPEVPDQYGSTDRRPGQPASQEV